MEHKKSYRASTCKYYRELKNKTPTLSGRVAPLGGNQPPNKLSLLTSEDVWKKLLINCWLEELKEWEVWSAICLVVKVL